MRTIVLAAALLAGGCVYSSPVPVGSEAEAPFDPALLGTWEGRGESDTNATKFEVTRAGERAYTVRVVEGSPVDSAGPARFFLARLDGSALLNLWDPQAETYSIARYRQAADTIELQFIAEWDTTFATSAELAAAVRARIGRPGFWDEKIRLVKLR